MQILSRYKSSLLVLSLYVALGLFFTYPLFINFTQALVGSGGDVYQNISSINNNYQNFTQIGYLKGIWNIISHLRLDPTIINTCLNYLFIQPVGYNLFWFFSFIASAYGVYLLVKFIFNNQGFNNYSATVSAFIAGIIYAFNPAHFAWGSFMGAQHIEWIPLTTLYIFKLIKKPTIKYFILSGLFFVLLVQGEPHFAAYYFLFLIPFFIYYLSQNRQIFKNKQFLKYSIIAFVLGTIITIWFYYPLINISVSGDNILNPGIKQAINYSPDILSIITPTEFHPLWAKYFTPVRDAFTGNTPTHSNYLGLTAVILFIFSLFYAKRAKIKEIYFWSLSALGFFVLSLGPFLHYLGTVEPKIPLPYLLLYQYVPFFENIRAVGRIWVIALLCFSVAIAFGLKYLLDHLSRNKKGLKIMISVVAFSMISLEYLAIPIPFSSLDYSPFYDQIKNEAGDFYIADIPGSINYIADAKTKYYASIHQKQLISGLDPARNIPGKWDLQTSTPVLSEILYTLPKGKNTPTDIINHDYPSLANKIFSYLNIPYIIVQKEFIGYEQDYIEPNDLAKLDNFITANFSLENIYDDKYITAYKVKKVDPVDFLFLSIGSGWETRNTEKNNRQIRDEAVLNVHNLYSSAKDLSLSMDMRSPINKFGSLSFYLNDKLIGNYYSFNEKAFLQLIIPNVPPGDSQITIRIKDYGMTNKTKVQINNINYSITEQTGTPGDFRLLNNNADTTVTFMPLFPSYYLQEARSKQAYIYSHPLLSPEDFILQDQAGNQTLIVKLPLLNELYVVDKDRYSQLETYRDIREVQYYTDNIANVIADKNIGYLLADKNTLNKQEQKDLSKHLKKYIPNLGVTEGKEYIIYTLPDTLKNKSVPFTFVSGWDVLENKSGLSKRRKINNTATLSLLSDTHQKVLIKFKVRTCADDFTYGTAEINGDTKSFTVIGDEFKDMTLVPDAVLNPGFNQLTIKISDDPINVEKESNCPIWISDISVYGT